MKIVLIVVGLVLQKRQSKYIDGVLLRNRAVHQQQVWDIYSRLKATRLFFKVMFGIMLGSIMFETSSQCSMPSVLTC